MNLVVLGSKFFLECLKVRCEVLCCSIFFSDINPSHFSVSLIFLILNDIDFGKYVDDSTLYNTCDDVNVVGKLWECQRKSCLNSLSIIEWKTTQIGFIWYQVQEGLHLKSSTGGASFDIKYKRFKSKLTLEIHLLKAFSVKNSSLLNLIIN